LLVYLSDYTLLQAEMKFLNSLHCEFNDFVILLLSAWIGVVGHKWQKAFGCVVEYDP